MTESPRWYPEVFALLATETDGMRDDIARKPECGMCEPLSKAVDGLRLATEHQLAPRVTFYENTPDVAEAASSTDSDPRLIGEADLRADGAAMLASVCAVRRGLAHCLGANPDGGCGLSDVQQKVAFEVHRPPAFGSEQL